MRKNILSLSIAAMIGGLGFVGSASAMTTWVNTGVTASNLVVSQTNRGHILTVPYFTTQNSNMTLLNIVNSDTTNGKAVKVRFRSALNSDDIFDFQLYLSAGDVWTGQVTAGANAGSALLTRDNSCTLPSSVNQPFVLDRLPPVTATFTAAQRLNLTREGYIEIFNIADIPPSTATGSLSRAITHVSGVPACAGLQAAALDLGNDKSYAQALAIGMTNPTGSLFANYSIVNIATNQAFSGEATAIVAASDTIGTPAAGALVWWPQTSAAATSPINNFTADPLLNTVGFAAAMFDLPDLSTPYMNIVGTPAALPITQAFLLTQALATKAVANEYLTDPSVVAATDWVFSMTTRRYNVAANYTAAATARRVYTDYSTVTYNSNPLSNFFDSTNTSVAADGLSICAAINPNAAYYDRSETTTGTQFVISPGVSASLTLCGETSVLSFNAGLASNSVLSSTVARSDVTLAYTDGWASFYTPGLGNKGLPITGKAFVKAVNASAAAGSTTTFGGSYEHKYTR